MKNWSEDFWIYLGVLSVLPLLTFAMGLAILILKILFKFFGFE